MAAKSLDDGIGRLLQFLFQLLNGYRQILIIFFAALSTVDDVANDEQEDCTKDDECPQNLSDGNNNRTPPLSR